MLMRLSANRSTMAAGLMMACVATSSAQVLPSSSGDIMIETFARGLDHPWALAFLPDGRMLVTERPGRMHIVGKDGKVSLAFAGVPKVFASGQGGLHDVVLDRSFADNHTIYFCFAEPVSGGARTALARARLLDEGAPGLADVAVVFHQDGPPSGGNHFGCRTWRRPGSLDRIRS
jgi:aldose sugar dehydrogenase